MIKKKRDGALQVTFWGVRGSSPGCNKDQQQVGGHTSCVSVELPDRLVIFDGGTGLTNLGQWVINTQYRRLDLFLSHGHFDHILGLPFFKPFWEKDFTIHLYSGPLCNAHSLEDFVKNRLFCHPLFPVSFDQLKASIFFHDIQGGEAYSFDTFYIKTLELNHPGVSLGFRVESQEKSMCYLSDMEHAKDNPHKDIVAFAKNTDLLIYDATYTDEEYVHHQGWGHSTWQEGIKLAKASTAFRLALYHHDASHADDHMQEIEVQAQNLFPNCFVARQDMKIIL